MDGAACFIKFGHSWFGLMAPCVVTGFRGVFPEVTVLPITWVSAVTVGYYGQDVGEATTAGENANYPT